MRRWTIAFVVPVLFAFASGNSFAQQSYVGADYDLELPSEQWRVVPQADNGQHVEHVELIYGDRNNGFLRIRKENVEPSTTPSDLCQRDQEQKLRFQTGYVTGKEEKFVGRLQGVTFGYEYTAGGKAMAGRLYYLQASSGIIYALRFTGLRDRLAIIRNQTDSIARSFRVR
jgi:hypothetical protein